MIHTFKPKSNNVVAVDYNDTTKILEVTFKGSGEYQYENVTLEEYHEIQNDDSTGKAVRRVLKEKKYKKL